MKLFAVFVGGNHARANIELHDLRFVAAETIEDTIPQLRAAWWGTPSSLHIDGYAELTHVDGRRIEVVPGPACAAPEPSLWFVNVGGYAPDLFGEQHTYLFMVGASKPEIWTRARQLTPDWISRHKDNLSDIDDILEVNTLLGTDGLHVRVGDVVPGAPGPRILSHYMPL
ncbi:DUF1543 domain-containing protein [Hyphomonas sp.]|uniref:DUF1543 domain-containing protein n=1 Tax=Hyphomonas sp. TaxID=87 RepID=UPI0039197881